MIRDILIKLIRTGMQKHEVTIENYVIPTSDYLADYLLENGVIVPPCKPGDTLWYLDYGLPKCFMVPERLIVQDIVITAQVVLIRCDKLVTLRVADFGRIVFLTREEAENALKESEEE